MTQYGGKNIHNSKKSTSKSYDATSEKITLKSILKTVAMSSVYSFFISEIVFLYFLLNGISKFPENLIVCLVVLSIGVGFADIFSSDSVVLLTLCTSAITLVFIFNYLFGSSPNPSIVGTADGIFIDFIAFGLLGPIVWFVFLETVSKTTYDILRKTKKISLRQAYSSFSKNIASIVNFFDKHPWIITVLASLFTLLLGILIGALRG